MISELHKSSLTIFLVSNTPKVWYCAYFSELLQYCNVKLIFLLLVVFAVPRFFLVIYPPNIPRDIVTHLLFLRIHLFAVYDFFSMFFNLSAINFSPSCLSRRLLNDCSKLEMQSQKLNYAPIRVSIEFLDVLLVQWQFGIKFVINFRVPNSYQCLILSAQSKICHPEDILLKN